MVGVKRILSVYYDIHPRRFCEPNLAGAKERVMAAALALRAGSQKNLSKGGFVPKYIPRSIVGRRGCSIGIHVKMSCFGSGIPGRIWFRLRWRQIFAFQPSSLLRPNKVAQIL